MRTKTRMAVSIATVGLLSCAGSAAAQTAITGHLTSVIGEPQKGAEIRIDGPGQHVSVRTDRNGDYRVSTLLPGAYTVSIQFASRENFVADHVSTRIGDPWHIDFDSRYVLATIRTEHSRKTRRFGWQGERTGSHLAGRWMETTSEIGYEPEASQLITRKGIAGSSYHPRGKPDPSDLEQDAR